jgi:hypothetical protein
MPGKSKLSTVVSLRIPLELLREIEKRVQAQVILPETRNELIVRVLSADILRKR